MACPTCGDAMVGVGVAALNIFHCRTCGTLKDTDGEYRAPLLVARCRALQEAVAPGSPGEALAPQVAKTVTALVHTSRILEAIRLPADRPKL